jgi:glycosidase
MNKNALVLMICLAALAAFSGCELEPASKPQTTTVSSKRNEGTWYQIMTGSFFDHNGDGIGDLAGITTKLDYLNDSQSFRHAQNLAVYGECNDSLHIDGIWLTPIMPAPSYHKYDTIDYMAVDPQFGTMDDFRTLLDECHKRGIKLIIDLVLNHTSDQHSWFKKALEEVRAGQPGRYAGYYNFYYGSIPPQKESIEYDYAWWDWDYDGYTNTPKKYIKSRFYRTWGNAAPGVWYEGSFWTGMPDLNWDNLDLRQEVEKVVEFWLSMGLDGFRLDATTWPYELDDGKKIWELYDTPDFLEKQEKNIALWTWFNKVCHAINDNVYLVGECASDKNTIANYYRSGMNFFAFQGKDNIHKGLNGDGAGYSWGLLEWERTIKGVNSRAVSAPFLTNHDQDRSFYDIGGEQWWINVNGINTRIRPDPTIRGNDRRRFAASLLLLGPGTPYIYYGDEIGLVNNVAYTSPVNAHNPDYLPNQDGVHAFDDSDRRGPMWWSNTNKAGIPNPPENRRWPDQAPPGGVGGVEEQFKNEYSLLRHYVRVGNLKRRHPFVAWGKLERITENIHNDLSVYRITDDDPHSATYGRSVVIAHNTRSTHDGGTDRFFLLPTAKWIDGISAQDLNWKPAIEPDTVTIRMPPYCSAIIGEYNDEE